MKKTVDLFKKIVKQSLMPLSDQTVSEWADSYRMISGEAAAEPGRWRTDRAPYQKAIMDAFTEPGITRVVAKDRISGWKVRYHEQCYWAVRASGARTDNDDPTNYRNITGL